MSYKPVFNVSNESKSPNDTIASIVKVSEEVRSAFLTISQAKMDKSDTYNKLVGEVAKVVQACKASLEPKNQIDNKPKGP